MTQQCQQCSRREARLQSILGQLRGIVAQLAVELDVKPTMSRLDLLRRLRAQIIDITETGG